MSDDVVRGLADAVSGAQPRDVRARRAADVLRDARGYRWVGIFDVADDRIESLGHSGAQSPDAPSFAAAGGLRAQAIAGAAPVLSPSGRETIVPILGAESGIAIGAVEVCAESTLDDDDRAFIERCAPALIALYE